MNAGLSEEAAETLAGARCLPTGPPRRIGVELEWLVRRAGEPEADIGAALSEAAIGPLETAGPLPGGGTVTREPGGQVELSSRPAPDLAACIADVETDLACIAAALAERGLELDGTGLDPCRTPNRIVDHPRYRAMAAYFAGQSAGEAMMCSTASVQINLDSGERAGVFDYRRRWTLAHRLGPILVASFANSPRAHGKATGWKSARQALWAQIDPDRTRPVADGGDPAPAWAAYALDAPLLCLRRSSPAPWTAPAGLTFRSWLRGRTPERGPTVDDLRYHLSTLFPPVRPRGWLELRMIDAQAGRDWIVPVALCAMLFDDPDASRSAWEATEPLADGSCPPWADWLRAARYGLDEPDLREAALACFAAASEALRRTGAPAAARRAVADYRARYVEPGRCPADDALEASLVPMPSSPAEIVQEVPS